MDTDKEKTIMEIIEEFFRKAGLEQGPENFTIENNLVSFELQTESPELLIGRKGRILSDMQCVLGRVLNKQLGEKVFVDIDINQYKKRRTAYIKEIAHRSADEVSLMKKEKTLFPMSSYERRIVHLALTGREDVKTESIGEEPGRRIVIRPV